MSARWIWSGVFVVLIGAVVSTRAVHYRPSLQRVGNNSNGTCVNAGCHAGIEDPHPLNLTCVQCHGGNAQETRLERSHVRKEPMTREEWSITGAIDRLSEKYVRFVNPGDLRVAGGTCGSSQCHADIVNRVKRSLHSTLSGYNALLVQFGAKAADEKNAFHAVYGIVSARDPLNGNKAIREGAVPQVDAFSQMTSPLVQKVLANGELSENCVGCHVNAYGANSGKGRFRSSGCAACHFTYSEDGRSQSSDPSLRQLSEPHPVKHEMHRVPDEQACRSCHVRGTRIMQNYKGKFERSGFNVQPDVHSKNGMTCVDCHTERDLHGDGAIYSRQVEAIEIRCETCHGTLTQSASLRTRGGRLLANVFRRPDGEIHLRLKKTNRLLRVPQIIDSLGPQSPQFNEAASIAHGRSDDDPQNGIGTKEATIKGFSHLDRVACESCHATWMHNPTAVCAIDSRRRRRNLLDGAMTAGVSTYRESFAPPTQFFLGFSPEGKIVPVIGQKALVSAGADKPHALLSHTKNQAVATFAPLSPHTNQKKAQDCAACHPSKDGRNARRIATIMGLNLLTTDPLHTGGVAKPKGIVNAYGYAPLDTLTLKRMLRIKVER
jgi:hypothetical protein